MARLYKNSNRERKKKKKKKRPPTMCANGTTQFLRVNAAQTTPNQNYCKCQIMVNGICALANVLRSVHAVSTVCCFSCRQAIGRGPQSTSRCREPYTRPGRVQVASKSRPSSGRFFAVKAESGHKAEAGPSHPSSRYATSSYDVSRSTDSSGTEKVTFLVEL